MRRLEHGGGAFLEAVSSCPARDTAFSCRCLRPAACKLHDFKDHPRTLVPPKFATHMRLTKVARDEYRTVKVNDPKKTVHNNV